MDRPLGVTILAVLNFIGAVLLVIGGLLFMLGMGMAGAAAGRGGEVGGMAGMGFLMALGAVAGVIFIVFGVIGGAIGIGLWKLKNWARIVTIVLTAISLLMGLAGLAMSLVSFDVFRLVFQLIFIGIYAWILWYMFQPHVKDAFGAS